MKILQQLKNKGLLDEFVSEFCIETDLGPQILRDKLESAVAWLSAHGLEPGPKVAPPTRQIKPEDFRLDQWARVVRNKLDVLETVDLSDIRMSPTFFAFDISVLYSLERSRLEGYPETIKRVREFAEKIGAHPFRKVNGDIDQEMVYDETYYDTYVKHPAKILMGNPNYLQEQFAEANECIGRP